VFVKVPENDQELNRMVEVHVRENLPLVKMGSYTRTKATCEFCESKHSYKDEFCDLKFDDNEANESVETAEATTIGQIIDAMKYERRLVLAIVLKQEEGNFNFNELRCKYRRNQSESDMTLDSRAQ